MFSVAKEVLVCSEDGVTTGELVEHAAKRPHVTREGPVEVQDDLWGSVGTCGNETLTRGRGAGNGAKVNEAELIVVGSVLLLINEGAQNIREYHWDHRRGHWAWART